MSSEYNPERVLDGHTCFNNAYVIEDYPYGRTLRCTKRIWVEQATKGHKKGQHRAVYCTTNPKSNDSWNKPKCGNYYDVVILYIEKETKYVKIAGCNYHSGVNEFKETFYHLLSDDEQKQKVDRLERIYKRMLERSKNITFTTVTEEI